MVVLLLIGAGMTLALPALPLPVGIGAPLGVVPPQAGAGDVLLYGFERAGDVLERAIDRAGGVLGK